jgi:hypothetical protein
MPAEKRYIFISHSGQDAHFARQLDATLLANGADTFLAERDIGIGDSIPERIYAEMAKATALIYIVSAKSVSSPWVQEELSIGKMREKQLRGFRIFPVLIDDLELPMSIVHIKYADFRSWRDSQSYRRECLELLDAMEIAPRLIGRYELRWWSSKPEGLRDINSRVADAIGVLWGGLDASQGHPRSGNENGDPCFAPTKHTFEDDRIMETLRTLHGMIENRDVLGSERLGVLREETQLALTKGSKVADGRGLGRYEDTRTIDDFVRSLRIVRDMLEELRSELEISLLSTVPLEKVDAANA